MADFTYDEHIGLYTPPEVFEVASQVSSLPSDNLRGFKLEVVDDVDRFDLGVHVSAGLKLGWLSYRIPGEITAFEPPELVRVEAETRLGQASLTLTVAANRKQGGTDITCLLATEPSRIGKAIEPALNPFLDRIMHTYADLYRDNVVQGLDAAAR